MDLLPILAWYVFLTALVIGAGQLLCGAGMLVAERVRKAFDLE